MYKVFRLHCTSIIKIAKKKYMEGQNIFFQFLENKYNLSITIILIMIYVFSTNVTVNLINILLCKLLQLILKSGLR